MPPCAQAQHFYIQKYTVNEGLVDSYVLNIFQDSQGFLWIGTAAGLSRFDGKEFVNYGYEAGLPDLRVDAIFEDANRRLWVGTRRGIAEIRGRRCVTYPPGDGLKINFVFRIKASPEHKPWAFTDKGLYCFDDGRWNKVRLYPGLDDHHCRDIIETREGMFINYGDLLILRNKEGADKVLGRCPQDIPYFNAFKKYQDSLYLSLPHGISSMHADGGRPVFEKALQNKDVGFFFRDRQGRFWINTEGDGLLISSPGSLDHITDTLPIPYQLVSDIFEDKEGNMWIACYNGLLKVREVNYTEFRGPLLNGVVNMVRTGDDRLLAATTRGLLEYKDGGFVTHSLVDSLRQPASVGLKGHAAPADLKGLPVSADLKGHPVSADLKGLPVSADLKGLPVSVGLKGLTDAWCMDSKGRTWLMMRGSGVFIFDGSRLQEVPTTATYPNGTNRGIDFNWRDGKIYLAADTLLLSGDETGLHIFHEPGTGKTIAGPRAVKCLGNGNVLVWTADNRYLMIDNSGMIRSVTGAIDIHQMSQRIKFYTEPSGKCWIIYGGGMALYHWNGQQYPVKELQVTSRENLPGDGVNDITMDGDHRLWAITSAGVVVIEPGSKAEDRLVVNQLSEEAGIFSDQWAHIGLLNDPAGFIWIYFPDRIIRLDPRQLRFDHQPPPVTIEDVQLTREAVSWSSWSDSLYGYRQLPHEISLPYYLNSLMISYRAPCFNGPSGVEYSYQLEGAWSQPTRSNSVTFVKLSPGEYHFRVRARKSNTGWSLPAEFIFSIGKPYWETWVFRAVCLLLILTTIAALFGVRLRRIQRKAMVREQVRELELKALRAQMNPHFIYNALNSIQALVLDDYPEKATMYISKFSRVLRQVLNHSERSVISLREELEALELYLQLEQLRLHVNLQYHIKPDPGIGLDSEWLPPLILQPFAENSLWHGLSRKKGEKRLDILLHAEGEWLVVEIVDNGIGREQAARYNGAWDAGAGPGKSAGKTSKGMEITGRRIREFNGEKDPSMVVTDLYEEGHPAGTRVVLRLRRVRAKKEKDA